MAAAGAAAPPPQALAGPFLPLMVTTLVGHVIQIYLPNISVDIFHELRWFEAFGAQLNCTHCFSFSCP
jgi:hypothetical protein